MDINLFEEIFQSVNIGVVVIDKNYTVHYWNRWLEINTKISSSKIIGKHINQYFPHINEIQFNRICKTVFSFGNHIFLSQKLHKYLLPIRVSSVFSKEFEFMQQSCNVFPIRENQVIKYACICINDVTEMVSYERKLISLATKDPLTGLYNRRFLYENLEKEINRCRRFNGNLSVIIIDIDFFKKINDNYGHLSGDKVIKKVASIILENIRKADIAARFGGEEFCCVLPETSMEGAYTLAERIRKKIEDGVFTFNDNTINLTISAGISEINFISPIPNVNSVNGDYVIKMADDALYMAKKSGRNRVICYNEELINLNG